MVEETNDAIVTTEDLKSIESEVMAKDKAKEDSIRKEVEASVRKELEEKAAVDALKAEKERLEKAVLEQAKEKERLAEEKAKEIEDLKKQIGTTKSVVNTNNPFQGKPKEGSSESLDFVKDLTDEQLQEIEENSKKAFMEHHGMKKEQF